MNKKKQKWSFVDLDDKDFETINKDSEKKNFLDANLTLNDLKNENIKNIQSSNNDEKWLKETNLSREDFEPIKKVDKKFEVDYNDILNEDSNNKQKILNNFFEDNKRYDNLKPRNTTRTFNQAIQNNEKNKAGYNFGEEKIKQFLTVREKLDVKTNIYLKSSIVIKLKELEERTNESRSSIINKLIEIALKNMEEK